MIGIGGEDMRRYVVVCLAGLLALCLVVPGTAVCAGSVTPTVSTDKTVYMPGDTVRLTYRLKNDSADTLTFAFTSSQRFDFTVAGGGVLFRWAKGRSFADVMGSLSVSGGGSLVQESTWKVPTDAREGAYTVLFSLTSHTALPYSASTSFGVGVSGGTASPAFKDIVGSFARVSIERLLSLGIVTGYPGGLFRPQGLVTRAEGAALVARARGLQPAAGTMVQWADVTPRHWAYSSIMALAAVLDKASLSWTGLRFEPSKPMTRMQFVVCMMAPAGDMGSFQLPFADVAEEAFGWREASTAYARGIAVGTLESGIRKLRPDDPITRAEAATLIDRFLALHQE
jgi:hypothetical protein